MDDTIGKSLGLDAAKPAKQEILEPEKPVVVVDDKSKEMNNDYTYARENFYNVIEKGTDALEQMLDVARASEHPRAYEVVSTLMKTLVDANKDLVDLSAKKNHVPEQVKNDNNVTNNNLFVGSTAELQSMLKDLRNDATED